MKTILYNRRGFLIPAGSMAAACFISSKVRARPVEGKYLGAARQFLDTMIEKGTDRFGKRSNGFTTRELWSFACKMNDANV